MERGMTADQIAGAIWRRKSLVAAIFAGVFAVGLALVLALPDVYQASVVVRVEPQRPSEDMVSRTVSELIEQRLLTVRQELLARPVLQRAIEEMNLYPELVSKKGIEAGVEAMRRDLEVRVEGETAFELTYRHSDPEVAAKVANRLPAIFADETLKSRQAQAARATELFDGELQVLQQQVTAWEKKIAQFKIDHIGELPEQLEMNMRGLERMAAMIQTKSEELRVADGRRSELARARYAADSEAGRLLAAESALTRELVAARTTWTPDHPEVQRMARELESVKQKRQEAEGKLWVERQERARAEATIAAIRKEIEEIQQKADAYQKRLDRTPQWTHELGVMMRDYEITKAKYQSVVSRKVEAEIAQELEAKSAKTLFNVVSPAGVPSAPAKPDRMGGLMIAFAIALALALLTAIVLEMRDESIRDSHEIKERLPIPVLAVVPTMAGAKAEKRVLLPATYTPGPNRVSPTSLN